MECVSQKSEIINTFSSVRDFSFKEKQSPLLDEEQMNGFLDAILDFKKGLSKKAQDIYDFSDRIEKLSWFNDLDEECLMVANDLISAAKDLSSTLIRQYVSMNFIRSKGIAKDEIKNFKNAIDVFKETYTDLESVLFFLPEMPDFVETSKELSLVK
ncbi:MAG: hypothetical protein GZ086_01550 [Gelidibacter sp.]|nr:hypothetical protein [Gelidibacter sp.]